MISMYIRAPCSRKQRTEVAVIEIFATTTSIR